MCARRNLLSIESQLDVIDTETEIVSGIHTVSAPGHTPGHMAVAVSSEGEHLLCISDAAILPIHLEQPDWHIVNDVSTERSLASRRRLLEMAVAERALVHGFHFLLPGLGHVVQKGERWHWQPIGTTREEDGNRGF